MNIIVRWNNWLKKLFIINFLLFTIVLGIILYIKISVCAINFIDDILNNKSLIKLDLTKLQANYRRQLLFAKNNIEQYYIDLNNKKLREFFDSNETLILDKSIISAIIVTDKDYNIKYSNIDKAPYGTNFKSLKRNYLNEIKKYPEKIVIGEIVQGILTNKPSIPLATGLIGKNGEFIGALIFSINLENLSRHLERSSLNTIKFLDSTKSEESKENISEVTNINAWSFAKKILFSSKNSFEVSIAYESSNRNVILNYNTNKIRKQFWIETGSLIGLSSFLFTILFIILYVYILKPLKPSSSEIFKLIPQNTSFVNMSFIDCVSQLIMLQHNKIVDKDKSLKEILDLSNNIVRHYNNKAEILSEDIENYLYNCSQFSKDSNLKALYNVKKISSDYEENIKFVSESMVEVIDLIGEHRKKPVNMIDALNNYGFNKYLNIDNNHTNNIELLNNRDNTTMLYKELFDKLLREIYSCKEQVDLFEINVKSNKIISFIFNNIKKDIIHNFGVIFSRCKILATLNNIKLNLYYKNDQVILNLLFD